MSQRNVARMKCCYSCAHYALESDDYPCSDCGHPAGAHSHWQDAVEAMRERCLAIVEALAEEFAAEILDAPYRIQTTEEARRRHGRILAAMSKIRGTE